MLLDLDLAKPSMCGQWNCRWMLVLLFEPKENTHPMNCSKLVMLTDATHLIFTSKGRSRPWSSAMTCAPDRSSFAASGVRIWSAAS